MPSALPIRYRLAVAFMATVAVSPALARVSLADRVERLEIQVAEVRGQDQNALLLELVERLRQTQTELQSLRGQLERQGFELEQMRRMQRDQYLDLESRLSRAQQGASSATPSTRQDSGAFSDPLAAVPVDSADPNLDAGDMPPLSGSEEPELQPALDPQVATTGLDSPSLPTAFASPEPVDRQAEKAAYDAAFDDLKAGRYVQAASGFERFLAQFPGSADAANAQFWLGESHYVTRRFDVALSAYQGLIDRYPDSSRVGDAMLKIGYCYSELKDLASARETLEAVIQRFPGTTVAKLAEGRLRGLDAERR